MTDHHTHAPLHDVVSVTPLGDRGPRYLIPRHTYRLYAAIELITWAAALLLLLAGVIGFFWPATATSAFSVSPLLLVVPVVIVGVGLLLALAVGHRRHRVGSTMDRRAPVAPVFELAVAVRRWTIFLAAAAFALITGFALLVLVATGHVLDPAGCLIFATTAPLAWATRPWRTARPRA